MAHKPVWSVDPRIPSFSGPIDIQSVGLACDTVQSYTLVLPNGTISEVDSKQPDLFFALKGGLNRFGIVTQITFKLFPQVPKVYVSTTTPSVEVHGSQV